jgi:ferredoxin-NADP reductase
MSSASQTAGLWKIATVVASNREAPKTVSLQLRLPQPSRHLAGQQYVVRLTDPDGYTASRAYPVVSAPDGSPEIEITVERLPASEVSMFLHDEVRLGDELEVRGPIGGWFVWPGDTAALLLGGGHAGIVPLMAMLRQARRTGTTDLLRVVLCVGTPAGLYYADELPGPETTIRYMYEAPASDPRPPAPLTEQDIPAMPSGALTYICGSSSFVDTATELVMEGGIPAERIRINRLTPWGSP